MRLRIEQSVSCSTGRRWQDRGPEFLQASFWRGQQKRLGSQGGDRRWGTRAGTKQEHSRKLAKEGRLRPTPGGTRSVQNHHWRDRKGGDKGKTKGDGKGNAKGCGETKGDGKGTGKGKTTGDGKGTGM